MRTLVATLAFIATSAFAQFPPAAWVVDEPGKLSAKGKQEIVSLLVNEDKTTGNQVLVAILKDLRGMDVADYGNQLFKTWKPGQKNKNNGVILLVGMKERKVRIDVGYGLESRLTDAKSKRILADYVSPKLKDGDFDAGIRAGVVQIIKTINSKD
jgi:uncharacterized protein